MVDVAIVFMHIAIMSKFETTFRTAVLNAERDVLVEQIRANPQMNLSELGKLATGGLAGLLGSITIGDLVGGGGGAAAPARAGKGRGGRKPGPKGSAAKRTGAKAAKPRGAKAAPAAAGGAEVDTRTAEGRAAYDANVLAALKGATGPQAASDLTNKVGGTPLQIRTALARLIEAGSVNWAGRARGTRYTAK
jgi:hypothetical protein